MFGSHKLFAPLKQLISDGKCLLILPATFQLSNAFVEIRGVIGFCGTVAIQNNNECEPTQKLNQQSDEKEGPRFAPILQMFAQGG